MGAKQTKVAEFVSNGFPDSNGLQLKEVSETPKKKIESIPNECTEVALHLETQPKLADNLRKRFFGGFVYNLNDPRSPGLNRTPILFDDKDKTLNLDDTFADLFVGNCVTTTTTSLNMEMVVDSVTQLNGNDINNPPTEFNEFEKSLSGNESNSVEFTSLCEEETMPSAAALQKTPTMFQQTLDPRSPTIGVTRTPIVFEDDEEAQEDAILENILATLSLDLSGTCSFDSFGTELVATSIETKKPTNKHLERVKKPEKPKRKSKQLAQKQKIFLDCENSNVTPKRKVKGTNDVTKRTPLSCMKNRSHVRSRSVESNGKSKRLSLTSYDDSLNPVVDSKIVDLHTLQGDMDLFDL